MNISTPTLLELKKLFPPNNSREWSSLTPNKWRDTKPLKKRLEPKATYPLLPNLQQNNNNNNIFGWVEGSIWWVDVTGCGSPWSRTEEVGHPHWPGSHNQHALCVCVAVWICCSGSLLTHMRQKMANAQRKTLEPSKRGQTIWNSVNTMESAIRDFRHFFSDQIAPSGRHLTNNWVWIVFPLDNSDHRPWKAKFCRSLRITVMAHKTRTYCWDPKLDNF